MSSPEDDDLPVAKPVNPLDRPPPRPREPRPYPERPYGDRPPTEGSLPIGVRQNEEDPPRPQALAACSVIGCLAIAAIAAVGILAYIALTLLDHANQQNQQNRGAIDPPTIATSLM